MPASLQFTALPVVFSDAGGETDLGSIVVDREFRVEKLRSAVACAARVLPDQISLSLVSPDARRRAAIADGFEISLAAADPGSFVLAAVRRGKKARSRRIRVDARSAGPEAGRTILKRQPPDEIDAAARSDKERFLAAAASAVWFSPCGYANVGPRAVCKICEEAVGSPPPGFHWCAYDAVLGPVGFRSSVGPIQRPARA